MELTILQVCVPNYLDFDDDNFVLWCAIIINSS